MEERSLDPVSVDLWTGSKKKTVPCEARCGAYHAGLEPSDPTPAPEACVVQGGGMSGGSGLSHHAAGFGVSLYGLEDPLPEVNDFGVHSRLLGQSTAGTPAYNAT